MNDTLRTHQQVRCLLRKRRYSHLDESESNGDIPAYKRLIGPILPLLSVVRARVGAFIQNALSASAFWPQHQRCCAYPHEKDQGFSAQSCDGLAPAPAGEGVVSAVVDPDSGEAGDEGEDACNDCRQRSET